MCLVYERVLTSQRFREKPLLWSRVIFTINKLPRILGQMMNLVTLSLSMILEQEDMVMGAPDDSL